MWLNSWWLICGLIELCDVLVCSVVVYNGDEISSPPVDIIWAMMMIVWRIREKIIPTVLCCVVFVSTKPRYWLGRTSLKWRILCRVRCKTLTPSIVTVTTDKKHLYWRELDSHVTHHEYGPCCSLLSTTASCTFLLHVCQWRTEAVSCYCWQRLNQLNVDLSDVQRLHGRGTIFHPETCSRLSRVVDVWSRMEADCWKLVWVTLYSAADMIVLNCESVISTGPVVTWSLPWYTSRLLPAVLLKHKPLLAHLYINRELVQTWT